MNVLTGVFRLVAVAQVRTSNDGVRRLRSLERTPRHWSNLSEARRQVRELVARRLAHSVAVRLRALLTHRKAYVASKPPEQNQSESANASNVARCQEFS